MGGAAESDWSEPATVEAGLLSPDDWTARFVSPLALGGLGRPRADPRRRAARAGAGGARPPVRHRPRRLHRDAQRPPRRRPRAGAGLDELPPPAALPDLRRHRPRSRGRQRTRGAARQRVVPGPARAGATGARCTGTGWRCSRNWRSRPPTARSTCSPPTRPGPRARAACSPTTSTTASAPTSGRGEATAATRWGRSRRLSPASSPPTGRPCARRRRSPRARCSARRPARRSSTSGRTWSAGCG